VAKRDRRFIFDFNESFMLKLGTYLWLEVGRAWARRSGLGLSPTFSFMK
jgi:hypothetical protein